MGLSTWHYMEMYERAAARNEALETKLRILSKATEWLAGVRGEVLGTDDIDELREIERGRRKMKVSDEIRNWREFEDCTECGGFVTKGSFDKLLALADRIDSEMVELPKDADGVPIHVGDTVWGCISGTQMAIHELRLKDRWTISTDTGFIPKASAVTHARPDSFERIADELEEMVDAADSADDRCEKLADLADRIRKLAKRED